MIDDFVVLVHSGCGPPSWSINPYRGCSLRCIYCCAGTQGISRPRFSSVQDMRLALRKALPSIPFDPLVCIGARADAYPKVEGQHGYTRAVLEELHAAAHPYNMLVKGYGITRDADILSDYSVKHSVWIVLCSIDTGSVAKLEPGAPPPAERIAGVGALLRAGVKVGVNAVPWIPGVTDMNALADAVPSDVTAILTHPLRIPGGGSPRPS